MCHVTTQSSVLRNSNHSATMNHVNSSWKAVAQAILSRYYVTITRLLSITRTVCSRRRSCMSRYYVPYANVIFFLSVKAVTPANGHISQLQKPSRAYREIQSQFKRSRAIRRSTFWIDSVFLNTALDGSCN